MSSKRSPFDSYSTEALEKAIDNMLAEVERRNNAPKKKERTESKIFDSGSFVELIRQQSGEFRLCWHGDRKAPIKSSNHYIIPKLGFVMVEHIGAFILDRESMVEEKAPLTTFMKMVLNEASKYFEQE